MTKYLRHYKCKLDQKQTEPEIRFKKWLDHALKGTDHLYETQAIFLNEKTGKGYIADFYLPSIQTVFEIDGKHHNEPSQKEYDQRRTIYFKSIGIEVVRIANDDTINTNCIKTIQDAVNKKSSLDAETQFTGTKSKNKKRYWE